RNSFQESVKAKMPADRIPGTASGNVMLTMARIRLAPSMRAHSSISFGMVLKYPIRSHVQNGIRNVGWVRMTAHGVWPSPNVFTTSPSGMKSRVGGTRYVMKIMVPSGAAHRNCRRASAEPAGSPHKRESAVDTVAMDNVVIGHP